MYNEKNDTFKNVFKIYISSLLKAVLFYIEQIVSYGADLLRSHDQPNTSLPQGALVIRHLLDNIINVENSCAYCCVNCDTFLRVI